MAALARSHGGRSHSRPMGGRHKAGHDGIKKMSEVESP